MRELSRRVPRSRKRYEHKLVREFLSKGCIAVRSPNSGASRYPYLDFFVWCREDRNLYAIELKTTKFKEVDAQYVLKMISESEIEKMKTLADYGAVVCVFVRILRQAKLLKYRVKFTEEGIELVETNEFPC